MELLKQLMEMTRDDFSGLRSIASRIFAEYGLRVKIVGHFFDRSVERDAVVSLQDVALALQKFKRAKHNAILAAKERGMAGEIVLKDLSTHTNIVFLLDFQNNEIVFKTMMRKRNFVVSRKLGGTEVFVEGLEEPQPPTGVKRRGKPGHKRWSGVQPSEKRMMKYLNLADKAEAT